MKTLITKNLHPLSQYNNTHSTYLVSIGVQWSLPARSDGSQGSEVGFTLSDLGLLRLLHLRGERESHTHLYSPV